MTRKTARDIINNKLSVLVRGWHLSGAGPARYGWAYRHATSVEFIGRTLADCELAATTKLREDHTVHSCVHCGHLLGEAVVKIHGTVYCDNCERDAL